mgnify:CR=1 FL=1
MNLQLIKGEKWGSGDATTHFYEGKQAIEIRNQSHWQECVWFRIGPESPWIKASGLCAPAGSENSRHFWTQEKLSALWNSQFLNMQL